MSWDVVIFKAQGEVKSYEDLAEEDKLPLGDRSEVHRVVLDIFKEADWSDPVWGTWENSFGSIEFNVGDEEPVVEIMLHVRAMPFVIPYILGLGQEEGWLALDLTTDEILQHSDHPSKGLEQWTAFRDQVVGSLQGEKKKPWWKFW